MKRQSLFFTGIKQVEVREEDFPQPEAENLHVQNRCSLISAGTEMLIYRGELPSDLLLDEVLPSLATPFSYPLKFGYSSVGQIISTVPEIKSSNAIDRTFAFNPHESAFATKHLPDLFVPENCANLDAIFLANMETAISIVMDAELQIGEKVVVVGLGVLGLLTSALLLEHPLGQLIGLDPYELRRSAAKDLGVNHLYHPSDAKSLDEGRKLLADNGADTVIELSGSPEALNLALDLVGPEGKIIVGSWYGQRSAQLKLGTKFHRGRIKLISSQVSRINPALSGRWNRSRRFALAWKWLSAIKPSRWITHKFPFAEAHKAYQQIDTHPEQSIAVVLEY